MIAHEARRPRRVLRAVVVLVVGTAMALVVGAIEPTTPPRVAAADDALTIRQQVFNVAVGGRLDITLGLPAGIDATALGPGAAITIVSHPAIVTRDVFLTALDGELGDIDDEFDISLDPADADQNVTRPSTDSLALTVPTSTSPLTVPTVEPGDRDEPDATDDTTATDQTTTTVAADITVGPDIAENGQGTLQFYDTGVHPVEIQLRISGRPLIETTTFVHIIDADQSFGDMSIGVVMGETVQPAVAVDGTVSVTPAETDELGRLADTLASMDAVPTTLGLTDTDVPRGVLVQPAILQAVMAADPELAARLTPGLVRSDIVATPRLPFEPSAAAAAGQDDRYSKLLSDGEDLLSQLLPRTTIDRTVHIVHEPFTTEAAELQRRMGARLMVMGFDFYNSGTGGNGMLTDTTQLVTIALPGDSSVPAAVVDPHLAKRFDAGADDPMLTSIQIVADLLVIAQSIDDDDGIVSRHGMMLARSDLGVPDAEMMSDLVTLLSSTAGLRLVEPTELGSTVDRLLRPGGSGEVTVALPDQTTIDLGDRVQLINDLSAEIFAFASMLPDGAPQIDAWLGVLNSLPSTAVDKSAAAAMAQGLRDQFDVYKSGIDGPSPFTFTLTSRSSTLTFNLRNNTDTELEVRVRLSSPKLTFPDGDLVVKLPPQDDTEVNMRAEALSNGKSSVFLRVYPPFEDSDIQVMPEVVLTARVSSLAGVGQLLTGAGLLLLLTWWGRHWQQTRRKRIAAGNIDRHPSANGAPPAGD